jgi:hypothetical protein
MAIFDTGTTLIVGQSIYTSASNAINQSTHIYVFSTLVLFAFNTPISINVGEKQSASPLPHSTSDLSPKAPVLALLVRRQMRL